MDLMEGRIDDLKDRLSSLSQQVNRLDSRMDAAEYDDDGYYD